MVLGGMRIGHEDRRHAAGRELGERARTRPRDSEVADGKGKVHALDESHDPHEQRPRRPRRRRDLLDVGRPGRHEHLQIVAVAQLVDRGRTS